MLGKRLIPILLLRQGGLMKSRGFTDWRYVGDPINTAKIFNDKDTDELTLLDVDASKEGRGPDFELIRNLTSECFLPISYGGGVSSLRDATKLIECGVDKVILNTSFLSNPPLIREIADVIGASSTVISIDFHSTPSGFEPRNARGRSPEEIFNLANSSGAGELLIQSVDRDGSRQGPDIELARFAAVSSQLPLIYAGGVSSLEMARPLWNLGFDGVAAGSWFVFNGSQQAVLVTYPKREKLEEAWQGL